MATFRKEILSPGLFHVGGGLFHQVKPNDLEAYAKSFKAMKEAGHRVPVCFEHPPLDAASGMPQLSDYDRAAAETKWNAGWVQDVGVDGGKLMATLDLPNPEDAQRVQAGTIRGVSPRLVNGKWTDGLGKNWEKFIGHVALTNRPKDYRQDNFSPLQLSEGKLFTIDLGEKMDDENENKDFLSDDDGGDDDTMLLDEPAPENPDMPVSNEPDQKMDALIAHLKAMGVVLSSDTNRENLVEHLLIAIGTKNAVEDKAKAEKEPEEENPDMPLREAQPSGMQFSDNPLHQKLTKTTRDMLANKIKAGIKRMKLAPACGAKLLEMANTVELSEGGDMAGQYNLSQVVDLLMSNSPDLSKLSQQVTDFSELPNKDDMQGKNKEAEEDALVKRVLAEKG